MVKFWQVSNIILKRSNRSFSIKEAVLKNFAIFIGKHLCYTLFNEFAGLQGGNFITKRIQDRYFPVNIAKIFEKSILKDICERLLLYFIDSK